MIPALNQIELHPYLTQGPLREYDTSHGIATEAWSPIAQGGDLLGDQVITSLADKYGKTRRRSSSGGISSSATSSSRSR